MLLEVSRIDDKALTMTFELYMDFMWKEARQELCSSRETQTDISRITVNQNSSGWGSAGHFMASTNFLKEMWLPDIQVSVLRDESYWTVLSPRYTCANCSLS